MEQLRGHGGFVCGWPIFTQEFYYLNLWINFKQKDSVFRKGPSLNWFPVIPVSAYLVYSDTLLG